MKLNFFVSVYYLLFISLSASAQSFTAFGELAKAEIDMKQCSFDTEAAAIVLLHEASSEYDDSYRLLTRHHVRIKILKEKGIANADISIPFYRKDDFEVVQITRAATINISPEGYFSETAV